MINIVYLSAVYNKRYLGNVRIINSFLARITMFKVNATYDVYVNSGAGGAISQAEYLIEVNGAKASVLAEELSNHISLSDYEIQEAEGNKIFMDWGGVTIRL